MAVTIWHRTEKKKVTKFLKRWKVVAGPRKKKVVNKRRSCALLLLYAHPSHLILAMWWRLGRINILYLPCCCCWQRAYFVHLENWLWRGELRKKKGNKFRFNPEISALFKSAENPFSLYNFKSSFFYKYGRLFSYQYVYAVCVLGMVVFYCTQQ